MTEEEDPNLDMMKAFAAWRLAEDVVADLEKVKADQMTTYTNKINEAKMRETEARLKVEAIMKKNGVTQDILEGEGCDYKIDYAQAPEVVKIVDDKAVPAEFVEETTVRSVKKREVMQHLKDLRALKKALPNWVTIERGESKAKWRAIKK